MGTTRIAAVLLVLVAVATAQDKPAVQKVQNLQRALARATAVMRSGMLARYELAPAAGVKSDRIPVDALERVHPVLRYLLCGDDEAAGLAAALWGQSTNGPVLVVRGTPEQVDAAKLVMEELGKAEPLRARLQCSLLTLPLAIARDHCREPGVVVDVDETAIGELTRSAVKNGGSLHNLPEVAASPLRPFALAVTAKAEVPDARRLRVRGEMVPASATEVAVRLQVVRGALPTEPTCAPQDALLQPIVRLQVGKAIMVMAVEGDAATVLVVRCVELANAPLPPPDVR